MPPSFLYTLIKRFARPDHFCDTPEALIASLYILECVALALAACVMALALGMAGLALASPWLLANYGLQIELRPLTPEEWTLMALVPVAAFTVALIPAFNTWRQSRRLGFGEAADQ